METEMGTEVERGGQGEKQLAGEEKIVQVKKSHLSKTMEVDLEKYVNLQSFVHIGLSHKWLLQSIQKLGKAFYKLSGILGKIHSEKRGVDATGMLVTTEEVRADALLPAPLPAQQRKKRQKSKTLFLCGCGYNTLAWVSPKIQMSTVSQEAGVG